MRLRAFGGLSIDTQARSLGGAAGQRRPLALLLLVATAGQGGMSRDKVAGLLWPESDRERGRNALRQTLHVIRRDLEAPDLISGTSDLRLDPGTMTSDVRDFDEALARGDLRAAIDLYTGPFADGFFLDGAPEFERWVEDERERRRRRFAEAVETLATAHARDGTDGAVSLWRRLAAQEPLDSRVAARLMQAVADAGDIPGALQHARVHEMLVRQELEVDPDPSVTSLAAALRARIAEESPRLEPVPAGPPITTDAEPLESIVSQSTRPDVALPTSTASTQSRVLLRFRRAVGIGAVVVTALAAGGIWRVTSGRGDASVLAANTYVVFPFEHEWETAADVLNGNQCAELLQDALGHWTDLNVIDDLRVEDALTVHGRNLGLHGVIETARRFHARYAVAGSISRIGDSLLIRARLYDVANGNAVRTATLRLGPRLEGVGARFAELATSLLMRRAGANWAGDTPTITTNLEAFRAYERARSAMSAWNLDTASADLRRATSLDPSFGRAWLALAATEVWSGRSFLPPAREAAARGRELAAQLTPDQRRLALALADLTSRRLPEACERFEAILRDDSTSFDALFGLAECHASDTVVVADPRSPTGMSFRGSLHTAERALTRALELVPSFLASYRGRAAARLGRILYIDARRVRTGIFVRHGDTIRVVAHPSLESDTIAFVPRTIEALRTDTSSASRLLAIQRNRRVLLDLTGTWTRALPQSAEAWEANAVALEAVGALASPGGGASALQAFQHARELASRDSAARDSVERRVRLAAGEARVSLKAGNFSRARAIADSALAMAGVVDASTSARLSGLAALTGRTERTAELMTAVAPIYQVNAPSGRRLDVSRPVVEAGLRLFAYSAFGAPADSLRAQERLLTRLLNANVAPSLHEDARASLLLVPLRLAYADLESGRALPAPLARDPLVEMQRARAALDTVALRALLERQRVRRMAVSAGDLTMDVILQEARLALALPDTALATQMLDRALDALAGQSTALVENPYTAAALVRAMALRAELALTRRELEAARRYARNVELLWSRGDPAVQPVLARMRAVLAAAR